MTIKTMRSESDGAIPGLQVVGFHGQLGTDQTPACCAPVLADDLGRHVRILESSPVESSSTYTLTIEIGSKPIPEGVWSTTGTRIQPSWPAKLGDIVTIIGTREFGLVDALVKRADGEVRDFLRWLQTDTDRSEKLRCVRIGELVAWYTKRSTSVVLRQAIAEQVRGQVFHAARASDAVTLLSKSFWLSRAAVDDDDLLLATAGLRHAGSPHWKLVLDAGLATGSEKNKAARVDAATKRLLGQSLDPEFWVALSADIRRALRYRVRNQTDLDDLVQNIMLACIDATYRQDQIQDLRTFCMGIKYRHLLDYYRQKSRHAGRFDPDIESLDDVEGVPRDRDLRLRPYLQELDTFMRTQLSVNECMVIELHAVHELRVSEMAEVLGVSPSTASALLSRARKKILQHHSLYAEAGTHASPVGTSGQTINQAELSNLADGELIKDDLAGDDDLAVIIPFVTALLRAG